MKSIRIFLLVLIIIGIILLLTQKSWVPGLVNKILLNEDATSMPVQASSIKGCYVAKLGKDVYTLFIQSEQNGVVVGRLAFSYSDEGDFSGTFNGTYADGILLGNYSFNSRVIDSNDSGVMVHKNQQVIFKKVDGGFNEGFGPVKTVGDKELLDPITEVIYDRQFNFTKSQNCLELFTDFEGDTTFEYDPLVFTLNPIDNKPTKNWAVNAKEDGVLLASLTLPKSYMPDTNFSDAQFTVGRSDDPKAVETCESEDPNNQTPGASAIISGYRFSKLTLSEAGAGNFYETTSYRGTPKNSCHIIEYTIHSTNIDNYPTEMGIREFNKSKVQNELESIVEGFNFGL